MSNDVSTATTTQRIQNALLDIVGAVPTTSCSSATDPKQEAQRLVFRAKAQTAAIAGGLALPPGPLGMLTIIPDLIIIWKIQAQLVADIAAVYGKSSVLRQESMLYCLFRHGVASLGRDLLTRVGNRVIIHKASLNFMSKMLTKVWIRITPRVLGRGISRWIPILGAAIVAGYAWYDTAQVAKSAIELFSSEISVDDKELDTPSA